MQKRAGTTRGESSGKMTFVCRAIHVLCLTLWLAPLHAGEAAPSEVVGDRHTDGLAGFSLCLPKGWVRAGDSAGGWPTSFTGPRTRKESPPPQVMIHFDESELSVEQDMAERQKALPEEELRRVTGMAAFTTESGVKGVTYCCESQSGAGQFYTRAYRFPGAAGTLVSIGFICSASDAERLELSFHAAAMSYRIEPAAAAGRLQADGRWLELAGGFSYVPPAHWRLCYLGSSSFKQALGPGEKNRAPLLVFFKPKNADPLSVYLEKRLAAPDPARKDVSQSAFVTDQGLKGLKLAGECTDARSREPRRFYEYLFDASAERKLRAYGRCLPEEAEKTEKAFDACVKTLRLEARAPGGEPEAGGKGP